MSTNKTPRSRWFIFLILGVLAALGIVMGLFFVSHPTWIGEQPGTADYVHRTLGLLSDMPHMTAELFYDAVENSIVFCIVWTLARKRFRKEHADFDRDHGITHKD
jgi:hypothetical protein